MCLIKGHSRQVAGVCMPYDHIRSHPDIIVNGFKKAGTIDTLENELPAPDILTTEDLQAVPFREATPHL